MRTFNDSGMQKYILVIDLLMLINIRSCVSLVNSMECNNTDYIKNTTANLIWQRSNFTITYLLHNTSSRIADDIMPPPFSLITMEEVKEEAGRSQFHLGTVNQRPLLSMKKLHC